MSLLEKYANFQDNGEPFAYSHETAGTDTRYIVETNDLQTNFRNSAYWKDYRYFFHDKDPAVKKQSASIHAYLQGAIRDRSASQEKSDDSFLKYQQEVLKLMFGMYVFVDPTKSGSEHFSDQMPYYLLGPMIGKELKPTFNFRFYYNVDKKAGKAGKAEFENPPEKWLRFFLAFNEFSRDTLPFVSQDFVKLFNYSNYRVKRKLPLEQENNILYIPSGEMDHCILQWLVLYLKEVHHVPPGNDLLRTSISFNLKRMYPGIQDFYEKNADRDYFIPNYWPEKKSDRNFKTPTKKMDSWLRLWGLLHEDDSPSERLVAGVRWLYDYLCSRTETTVPGETYPIRHYLALADLDPADPAYDYLSGPDKTIRDKFQVLAAEYFSASSGHGARGKFFRELLKTYFALLLNWDEQAGGRNKAATSYEIFAERCRFRPFVHLIFRNFITAADSAFAEHTCRGFVVIPVLNTHQMNDALNSEASFQNQPITCVGYFLSHIKDSDEQGRCLYLTEGKPKDGPAETNLYFTVLKQVVNYLGRIEVERIYYKGIVNRHQENAITQSIHSAVAACMSRNLSHTTGSHKSPFFKNFIGLYLRELKAYSKEESDDFPEVIYDAIKSIHNSKSFFLKPADRDKEMDILNTHLLSYFDFVNDNMEFIADITTNYISEKVTYNYLVKEVYEEYGSLRLMHHGLFDDHKLAIYLNLLAVGGNGNKYDTAAVALPNGQLGKTAFFIILENIIRNYYKHSRLETQRPEFKIMITSPARLRNEYWCVDFFDNAPAGETGRGRDARLLDKINNEYINRSIIEKNGKLRGEGWGFIEMKACCAYLVNYPIDHIDRQKNREGFIRLEDGEFHPLLEAGYYNDHGEKVDPETNTADRNLGYRFYLKKARKIGIDETAFTFTGEEEPLIAEALANGIRIVGEKDLNPKTQFDVLLLKTRKAQLDPNQRVAYNQKVNFSACKTAQEIELFAWVAYMKSRFNYNYSDDFQMVKTSEELKIMQELVSRKRILVLDDHGEIFREQVLTYDKLKEYLWYLPKENRTRRDVNFFLNQEKDILTHLRLIEVLQTKIAIFDERIQQETSADYASIPTMKLREIHQLGDIYIPGNDFDLTTEAALGSLEDAIRERFKNDDYVIVHFTLFEKMAEDKGYNKTFRKTDKRNIGAYHKQLITEWQLEKQKKFLVFCSGRGKPTNLFPGCYYIHLSTLQYFTVRTISKYSLVNVLKSLRKI